MFNDVRKKEGRKGGKGSWGQRAGETSTTLTSSSIQKNGLWVQRNNAPRSRKALGMKEKQGRLGGCQRPKIPSFQDSKKKKKKCCSNRRRRGLKTGEKNNATGNSSHYPDGLRLEVTRSSPQKHHQKRT